MTKITHPDDFETWLARQSDRDDPIGDLAQDAERDPPNDWSPDALRSHIERRGGCMEAVIAARWAGDEWRAYVTAARRFNDLFDV